MIQVNSMEKAKSSPSVEHLLEQRRAFAHSLVDCDDKWATIFHGTPFSDLTYSDMLLRLWDLGKETISKTELYHSIHFVSYGTAVKYVQLAIDQGIIEELEDAQDRRVRRVRLSSKARAKVEQWIDYALKRFIPV